MIVISSLDVIPEARPEELALARTTTACLSLDVAARPAAEAARDALAQAFGLAASPDSEPDGASTARSGSPYGLRRVQGRAAGPARGPRGPYDPIRPCDPTQGLLWEVRWATPTAV